MNYLPIPEYEGFYEVSDTGFVRSVDRIVTGKDGVEYPFKGRVLRATKHKDTGYLMVSLWRDAKQITVYVHRLVALLHVPNPHNKPEVNHKDGNRQNAQASNLEWCTSQENSIHAIETGLLTYTNRLTKSEFVEALFSVIDGESYLSLSKRTPYKVPFLSTKLRKIARELGLENDLDESLYIQRVEGARINGAKNK